MITSNFYQITVSEFDLIKGPNYRLKARLYCPIGIENMPAVVCVHGGAWVSGDRTAVSGLTDLIAQTGIAVLSIDTRLAPEFTYPAPIIDVIQSVGWLKQHANDYRIDANRIGLFGVSSGGYLAMLVAIQYDWPEFSADIPITDVSVAFLATCSGVLDPWERYQMAIRQNNTDIMMCHNAFFKTEQIMENASLRKILATQKSHCLMPAIFFQGQLDPRLPIDTAEKTARFLNTIGGKAQAIIYKNAAHSLDTWPRTALIDMLTRFHQLASAPEAFSVNQKTEVLFV